MVLDLKADGKPVNMLWALDLSIIPIDPETHTYDFSLYDKRSGTNTPLPLRWLTPVTKLVAAFKVVDIIGDKWTVKTDYNAPRGRWAMAEP